MVAGAVLFLLHRAAVIRKVNQIRIQISWSLKQMISSNDFFKSGRMKLRIPPNEIKAFFSRPVPGCSQGYESTNIQVFLSW